MRIIANENFPGDAVQALRAKGHDVVWIRTDAPGISDRRILEKAQSEKRLVVTFDKDFGELAFQFGLPAECGIILFRVPPLSTDYVISLILQVLNEREDWSNCFAVVEPGFVRIRPLNPHP
ncbi:MAG: DUF5615 family PIN-like protein [Candidatus Sumerlaeota bacterium]|nr:DUF5615 family PIN-like protein [Candidatus Sumerlaeota bacterium]